MNTQGITKLSAITLAVLSSLGLFASQAALAVDNSAGNGTANTSIAIGSTSNTNAAANAIAIGSNASVNQYDSAYAAASNSKKSRYTGAGSIAAGLNASVSGSNSIATGVNATASGWKTTAIGSDSNAEGDGSIAMGDTAKALSGIVYDNPSSGGAVAIGQNAQTVAQGSVAIGGSSKASSWRSTAVGWESQALTESSTAMGNQSIANGWGATAIGTISNATGYNATAVGNNAHADGTYTSAFGTGASAYSDSTKGYAAALALGTLTAAEGNRTTAIGYNIYTTGNYAISIGSNSTAHKAQANASGERSITIGLDTVASANDAIALGAKTKASVASSVALGNASTTTAGVDTNAATVGGLAYSGFAGSTASSVVSVGTTNYQRQIQNVAAGQINSSSTDAINGSQLYAVMQTLNNVTSSLVNVLGGNAAVSPSGIISMTNVGNTGQTNIHNAIEQSGTNGSSTIVKAGKNINVTQSGNTYTVATNDDMIVNSITAGNTVVNTNGVSIQDGPSITQDGIDMNNKRITNVQAGVNGTDAVNVNQLNEVRQDVNDLRSHVHRMDKKLRAGIAGALASAGLYQATAAGKSMVSIGGGTYKGESAVAVGYSRLSDDAKWGVKMSVNSNSRSDFGAAASVGYQF